MRKYLGLLVVALALTVSPRAVAQGSLFGPNQVQDTSGNAIPGVPVRVCTSGATGNPCSPLATVYTDATLGTTCTGGSSGCANPTFTDSSGGFYNYGCAPGVYTFQYTLLGHTITQKIPCPAISTTASNPSGPLGQVLIGQGIGVPSAFADPLVQGTQAAGSVTQPNPVLGGAWDGTALRAVSSDASGRFNVNVNGTVPVSGTFWQATQPVSGTFWQATQPVSSTQLPAALDGSGFLKVHEQGTATVSGTVTANAGTGTFNIQSNASVNQSQWNGTTVDTNSGSKSAGTLRVVLATDQPALTNKLLVTADPITFASAQAVTQSGTWNIRNQDGAGNALTSNSTTFTAKFGLDANLLGTLGTAFTTAGKVDVKAADGDVFVRQATGTNLHTVVDSLPANASINNVQWNGNTVDTNSGVKSAGTVRVVLATDQPQLTNKLLVTPDSVALPANQSVNVNQVAGTTTDTNSGTKSAGTMRVVLATDQPQLTNKLLVTPDANSAVNVAQVGGTAVVADPCQANAKSYVAINQTSGTRLATGTSAKKIYVCAINLVTASAQNIALVEGTGTVCATGIAGMAGGTTAATGWNFAANGGLTLGNGTGALIAEATNADDMCLLQSAAGQVSGSVAYVVQ